MQLQASVLAMTSTEVPDELGAGRGHVHFSVFTLHQGGGLVVVSWGGDSPWVPTGSLELSTNDQTVVALTAGQIVEGVIRQLRPVLQSMVQEVWQPF